MTILLTGTHLTPAIATIQVLRRKAPEAILVYVGRKHTGTAESVEKQEIERAGAEFRALVFGKLHRHFTWRQILELVKFPAGFWQAGRLVLELRPEVVVSFGGYVALPLVIWGKLTGARIVVHEQTSQWGLANRLSRGLADVKAVSWREMEGPGVVWTGNPIRKEVIAARQRRDDPRWHFFDALGPSEDSGIIFSGDARQRNSNSDVGILKTRSLTVRPIREFDFKSSFDVTGSLFPRKNIPSSSSSTFPILYITGGNQGSRSIDKVIEPILPDLVEKFEVFHQTKSKFNFKHPRYHQAPWFSTPIHAEILSRTAVSVSRAGANTVAELMYLGIPSVLVPLPHSAGGEQQKNARILEKAGLGRIINQDESSPEKLLSAIMEYKGRRKKEEGRRKLVKNDAGDKLAEIILKSVDDRR